MVAVAALVLLAGCGGATEEPALEAQTSAVQDDSGQASPPAQQAPSAAPEETQGTSACQMAFADAAAVDPLQDSHADLWPAFDACADLAEFSAASQMHPDALDGVDPETYATEQCAAEPELQDSPVCRDADGS